MRYPILTELPTSREIVDVFKGYNHNLRIGGGEFYDMTNLSSDNYPVLCPRAKRGKYLELKNPQGVIAKDALCYVDCIAVEHADGARFYINGKEVEGLTLSSKAEDCPKTLVSMGAYVIILPDKKWVNTQPKEGEEAYGNIEVEVEWDAAANGVHIYMCDIEGNSIHVDKYSSEEPVSPTDGYRWVDLSSKPYKVQEYSADTALWASIANTYLEIFFPNAGKSFEVGDSVDITGLSHEYLEMGSPAIIRAKGDDYIIVDGFLYDGSGLEELGTISIKRQMPLMDFVIESGNRLWGCRYGVALNGEVVNEIYASKLGDFKNWNSFAGVSTDSYAATVGTDGQFTGAISHLGYPIFFKETCMHKVYGNYPANFQIQTMACRGVQEGCERSLAVVNEVLYYKSRSGICAYDGSLPADVSSALGEIPYRNAVAGALGNKYYISMQDNNNAHHLFVCDTMRGMWHREDDTQAVGFCTCRGHLYYVDYADNSIKVIRGSGDIIKEVAGITETSPIEWEAVTGVIGTDSPDKKYISRMDVRMSLAVGARVSFYAEYDSSGEWEHLFTMDGVRLRSFAVPIRPQRCDHLRLKIVGNGEAKIYSICKTIEQGSDV